MAQQGQKRKLAESGKRCSNNLILASEAYTFSAIARGDRQDMAQQQIKRVKSAVSRARNATPDLVARWQRQLVNLDAAKRIERLKYSLQAEAQDSARAVQIRSDLQSAIRSRHSLDTLIRLYDEHHSHLPPPHSENSSVVNKDAPVAGLSDAHDDSHVSSRNENTAAIDDASAHAPAYNLPLTSKPSSKSSGRPYTPLYQEKSSRGVVRSLDQNSKVAHNITANKPIFFYEHDELWIRKIGGLGILLGINARRLAQIQQETFTRITVKPCPQQSDSTYNGYHHCRIQGSAYGIHSARSIIEKLLGGGENGYTEGQRLDTAARQISSHELRMSEQFPKVMATPQRTVAEASKGTSATQHAARVVSNQPVPAFSTLNIAASPAARAPISLSQATLHTRSSPVCLPAATPKLTRFTLGESDEETSSSSSEDEDMSSSNDDSESESGVRPAIIPQASTVCEEPSYKNPVGSRTTTGAPVVIKIEDDSEDESPVLLQTPETYRRENNLSSIPASGSLRVSEVERMLDLRDAKAAHLSQKVRILEYALHYKGVTDFQITRMHAQVGEKGDWNTKFAEILGEPRKGNERDGAALTAADLRRVQRGSIGLRRTS